MEHRIRIPIRNRGAADLVVVVEPWAREVCLAAGEDAEVVLIGNDQVPNHSVELCPYGLIIWAGDGMDCFELYKGGERWG
jgi:hypothetical protein